MAVVLQDLVDALEVVVRVSVGGVARPFREKIGNFDTATQRGLKKIDKPEPVLEGKLCDVHESHLQLRVEAVAGPHHLVLQAEPGADCLGVPRPDAAAHQGLVHRSLVPPVVAVGRVRVRQAGDVVLKAHDNKWPRLHFMLKNENAK